MRVLHSADWHLSNRQTIMGRFILQKGMNFPLIDRIEALEKICSCVEGENIDLVIIAGDVFDTANPESVAIKIAVRTIERLAGAVPVVICSGNHDWKGGVAGALAPFGDIARRNGIHISERPESFSLAIKNTKVNLFVLPYPRRSEIEETEQLKSASPEDISIHVSRKAEEILAGFQAQIERDAVNILVGHFAVAGSIYSKEQSVPPFDISIRTEFLESFDLVCLGHLHEPQEFYSGAIARNGFGEQHMRVGFKVYSLAMGSSGKKICDLEETFVELPARKYVTLSPEDFMAASDFDRETAIRVKGKVPKHRYDEIVRRMKSLDHPFMKNALEIEVELAGAGDGQDVSREPDIEAALRMWAKGREGMDKFIDRLIAKGKEIESKIMEVG